MRPQVILPAIRANIVIAWALNAKFSLAVHLAVVSVVLWGRSEKQVKKIPDILQILGSISAPAIAKFYLII